VDFQVKRDDLHRCRVVDAPAPELEPGQVLLEVSAFGLTSNNITYAVFGDTMSYWEFFPAEGGWGRIPVWGFATARDTAHDGVEEGTRLYGYLPPSTYLVVTPTRVEERGFVDASPHRSNLPSAYNAYRRTEGDPSYRPEHEDQQMLLWPLFVTSFLLADLLDDEGLFGASTALISSASSKTASAAAFLLSRRGGVEVIGLTSARSAAFVERLGVYERTVTYDDLRSLPKQSAVYVDVSGDVEVRGEVHRHLDEALVYDCLVGAAHRDRLATGSDEALPGPKPSFFFAPDRVRKRVRDWGPDGLDDRVAEAWHPYVEWATGWLEVVHGQGPEALERAYLELLEGRTDPSVGHVISLAAVR
jgi:hypothetical protein